MHDSRTTTIVLHSMMVNVNLICRNTLINLAKERAVMSLWNPIHSGMSEAVIAGDLETNQETFPSLREEKHEDSVETFPSLREENMKTV